ncbi:FecR domain-containing protein [Cellvibrio sp.]|uniref:FecR domain-containing protein n=1 Tax=Cellvibrio sp. TaxID=1965322 RepID=UPI003F4B4199
MQQTSDADIIQQAAAWMARMLADDVSAEDQQALLQWRMADTRHEMVWQKLQQVSNRFSALPNTVSSKTLLPSHGVNRRQLLQWASIGGLLAGTGWYGNQQQIPQRYLADYRTTTGEVRPVSLQDGSQLYLNTNTAIDVHFDAHERKIILHQGEILLSTGHETPRRVFFVETRFGRITALGTRFSVRQLDDRIRVAVQEGDVEIQPANANANLRIAAGEQLEFTATLIEQPTQASTNTAWRDGLLVAEHMRLADFTAELARYRRGLLTCDERVAELKISGVFSLTNTERALANLQRSLPVTVQYRTRYWARLMPSSP